ncbi:unnamed protein product [Owenia fusiformis]|uniref:Uncharacterized protein n=1 Tax=Owenia fusiformis TaxID=6347 RepID=A0A8J1UAQ2_OWEFU|nr:unnamed protein product [Owenia fusiformis]
MENIKVTSFMTGFSSFFIIGVFFISQAQSNYYKLGGVGRRVNGTAAEDFFDIVNTTECILRCVDNIECLSLNYNSVTLECLIYTVDGLEKYDDPDWTYVYAKRGAGVFHVEGSGGRYSIADPTVAESVCTNNYNAVSLATPEQLAAMVANGFFMCKCGWVTDRSSVIPLNYTTSGCGGLSAPPGVLTCVNPGGALPGYAPNGQDAYCYTDF